MVVVRNRTNTSTIPISCLYLNFTTWVSKLILYAIVDKYHKLQSKSTSIEVRKEPNIRSGGLVCLFRYYTPISRCSVLMGEYSKP